MNADDKKIADTLARYGEPFAGNVWRVQGNAVIYHRALERIAAQAQIRFDTPQILRAERDEAVILVTGHLGPDRTEWSIGEALINVNYRVTPKMAAYPYAMAEKRAKDRVILKLIELHGLVYSDEEADEFRRDPTSSPEEHLTAGSSADTDIINKEEAARAQRDLAQTLLPEEPLGSTIFKWCAEQIKSKKTAKALEDWQYDSYTKKMVDKMKLANPDEYERVKTIYKERLATLRPKRRGRNGHDAETGEPGRDPAQAA